MDFFHFSRLFADYFRILRLFQVLHVSGHRAYGGSWVKDVVSYRVLTTQRQTCQMTRPSSVVVLNWFLESSCPCWSVLLPCVTPAYSTCHTKHADTSTATLRLSVSVPQTFSVYSRYWTNWLLTVLLLPLLTVLWYRWLDIRKSIWSVKNKW